MLAQPLRRGRELQQRLLVEAVQRDDFDEARVTRRQGAGLVEDDRVDARECPHGRTLFDEAATYGRVPD